MSTAPDRPALRSPRTRSCGAKIFRRVVPLFFVMFVANYVDRVNIGFAQDQLRADVGISAAAFGILQDATGSTRGGLIGLSVWASWRRSAWRWSAAAGTASGTAAGGPGPEITDPAVVLCAVARHAYGEARLSGGAPQWSRK
ncbi:hypothetical protein ACIPXV_01715 [Streptomyces libani]|uniref:hypothetical protein n=1 Tax=Streptomyces nigrescens TaxID=1920 RepID=UPI003818236C